MSLDDKDEGQPDVGNLSSPEDVITTDLIQKILHGHDPDAKLVSYSAKLGTKTGDNFMSIIYSADILFTNSSSSEEKLEVMIKTMPKNEFRVEELNKVAAFTKEVNMYAHVLPEMVRFQKEQKIEDVEIMADWPACLASFSNGGIDDFVAMGNLRGKGYKMADRIKGLDHPQILLVLSTLAKFHAISFAQFGGDGAKIMSTYPFLEEKMFPDPAELEHSLKDYFKSLLRCEVKVLRDSGHEKEAEILALFCRDDIDVTLLSEISTIVTSRKNAVINHGDCWTNNILFLHDGEKLVDLKLLDFQEARCAPRSAEVSYFLHACVPSKELDVHKEEEYLKWYDDHFIQFLGKLGVNRSGNDGLDFKDFMEEYKNCKFYGVILGLLMAPMMCTESEDLQDLEDMEGFGEDAATRMFEARTKASKDSQLISTNKICNLAVNHLPHCPQVIRKMSEIKKV
ncbi:uncharacterized protein LOC110856263 [Folsomia candida]|uniref:CHK kinase-like domain-containing protein n=1 Tax=Folsomia candida TaxID=158441 RepID=A0A226EXB8_FOLCA|nr:uncharacterized protein LOC110856263 [Folsomia candida]XP_021960442.1 uncharacterized protein LOC110856263 [Folsomia candida]XP_035702406.1 uncharacterized protein LOC110856263 [Folsomia candida]OXA61818.1 hypothetical protein Fcan01_00865 [Folsomia candida]